MIRRALAAVPPASGAVVMATEALAVLAATLAASEAARWHPPLGDRLPAGHVRLVQLRRRLGRDHALRTDSGVGGVRALAGALRRHDAALCARTATGLRRCRLHPDRAMRGSERASGMRSNGRRKE